MIQQLKLAAFVVLIGLAVVLLLTVTCGNASGGDYVVTRSTTIESQRPIWLLVTEAGLGVINGNGGNRSWRDGFRGAEIGDSELRIDGHPAPGIGGMVSAAWRLVGFVVWDEAGRIERVTDLQFRGRSVRIVDAVSNGRVWIRVVVGPPLGDPRVRYAVLEATADEADQDQVSIRRAFNDYVRGSDAVWTGHTRIRLACSAIIDLPGRCRLVRRIAQRVAQRVAQREAGAELEMRVDRIAEDGIRAVRDGRSEISEAVSAFLERVCR